MRKENKNCDLGYTPNQFTNSILNWYNENGRDLPWRHTTDPYKIWLSEVILQQTRIQQGLDYWLKFIQLFPTVNDLAAATEDKVLKAWQGLGYYSRARNLHHAARQIVEMGKFPSTYENIKKLKGVGDYTAAAIASFAFKIPRAAVDGNVFRVLSRHYGIDTPINSTEGKKVFTAMAQSLIHPDYPDSFNQAMMDFGATQCTPTSPACPTCPLNETCYALRNGKIESLPTKNKNLKIRTRHFKFVYIRCNGETAIRKRPAGDIWQGLWQPILIEEDEKELPNAPLKIIKHQLKHQLTHQTIFADLYLWETNKKPRLEEGYIWIKEEKLKDYALPRLVELLIEEI